MNQQQLIDEYNRIAYARQDNIMNGQPSTPEWDAILAHGSAEAYANAKMGAAAGGGTGTPTTIPGSVTAPTTSTPTTLTASGGGFNALTPTNVTNLPSNPNVSTTNTGTGTANQTTSPYSYAQLVGMYKAEHPGVTNLDSNAFNQWTGSKGIGSWSESSPEQIQAAWGNLPASTTTVAQPANTGTPAAGSAFNQTQAGGQTGSFSTAGTNNQNTTGTTGGTSNTNTTGSVTNNQNTTGTTTGATTNTGTTTGTQTGTQQGTTGQTTTGTGTTTTGVNDSLGFGALLQGAAGSAQANDATRNAFLTDLVTNGGSSMNSQFDQAIRNSISGPQMTGAGDSARARAAGYAGAQVARQNTGDRLNAASQLAGPTSLTQLVSAGNPYLGSTQTTSGSTNATGFNNLVSGLTNTGTSTNAGTSTGTSNQNSSGTQNTTGSTTGATTGFANQNTNGSESTGGTAAGTSTQSAAGNAPTQQQVQTGGGCIICTVGIEHGLWKNKRILRRVVSHKLNRAYPRFAGAAAGYFRLFTPTAKLLLLNPRLAVAIMPLARSVVYEELRISGRRLPFKSIPWALHWTWHGLCSLVGKLPGTSRNLTDPTLITVAKKHGVFFQLGG